VNTKLQTCEMKRSMRGTDLTTALSFTSAGWISEISDMSSCMGCTGQH
jgi:hypothetical protein